MLLFNDYLKYLSRVYKIIKLKRELKTVNKTNYG